MHINSMLNTYSYVIRVRTFVALRIDFLIMLKITSTKISA